MHILKITKGWYWSAGDKYGWNDNYDRTGIGIALSHIRKADPVRLEIKDEKYEITHDELKRFIGQYKTKKKLKGVPIIYVSKSVLNKVEEYSPQKVRTVEIVEQDGQKVAKIKYI